MAAEQENGQSYVNSVSYVGKEEVVDDNLLMSVLGEQWIKTQCSKPGKRPRTYNPYHTYNSPNNETVQAEPPNSSNNSSNSPRKTPATSTETHTETTSTPQKQQQKKANKKSNGKSNRSEKKTVTEKT